MMPNVSQRRAWRASEWVCACLALVALVISTLALLFAHTAVEITAVAVILGLSLGPVFPVTFALILGRKPSPRQAGVILAASGLGAALLPWLMGVLSRQSGSLRTAFLLPLAVAVGLLIFSFRPAVQHNSELSAAGGQLP